MIKISREMSSNMRSKLAGLSTSHHFRRGISNCGETRQLPGVTGPWGKIAEVKPAGLARTGPARPGRQWNRSCFYFLVQLLIRFYATRSKSKRIPMSLSDSAASGGNISKTPQTFVEPVKHAEKKYPLIIMKLGKGLCSVVAMISCVDADFSDLKRRARAHFARCDATKKRSAEANKIGQNLTALLSCPRKDV